MAKPHRILIVDDDPRGLYALQVLLESRGYRVETAQNGKEALEKAKKSPPDEVISDILMPVMDGFTLCRKWHEDNRLKKIPFVFYSATYTEDRDEELGLSLGAVRFIRKPIDPEEFLKQIEAVVSGIEKGRITPAEIPLLKEEESFKLYSERLVKKLEDKIIQLQEAMKGLEKSEAQYRTLVEQIPGLVYMASADEKGSTLYISPKIERMKGFTVKEWLSDPDMWSKQIYPDDRKRVLAEYKDAYEKGVPFKSSYRMLTKGGEVKWFRDEAEVVKDKEGRPLFLQGVMIDITESKKTEEALRSSEERYRTLVENSSDGILMLDEERNMISSNQAYCRLFGYSKDEIEGKSTKMLHPSDESFRSFGEAVYPIIQKAGSCRIEWELIRKDRTLIPVEIALSAIKTPDERIAGYVSIIGDISERKRMEKEKRGLEDQLHQSQKMEAIGVLAGGVAHDFNNLLTIIGGTCDLLLLDLREGDPLKSNIDEIKKASNRAAGLTRQLLAFSRRQVMEMRVFDLDDILRNMEKMLRRLIGEDVELIMALSDRLGRIKSDAGQVEQVILNLVVNAREAMPKGGRLTLETANAELGGEFVRSHLGAKAGQYVMLRVIDTGVGMTREVRERVFEPFFTTKEKGRGTGLGLSTVYGIVKQSEGNIWIDSEPGRGTTFTIYLPRVEELEPEQRAEEEKERRLEGNETILVVEDEEDVRRLAVGILKKHGYEVLEAPGGGDAFLICEKRKEPIHLILTDVVMPRMSGREVVERLKLLHPEMKVIYMSGYTDEIVSKHGVLMEGAHFIQKPFDIERLLKKVRNVLDEGR